MVKRPPLALLAAVILLIVNRWLPAGQNDHFVVILSWDGGKPTVIADLMDRGHLPVTAQLVRQGAFTFSARTTLPSSTLPSHASMVTGVGPDRHRILWNDYREENGYVLLPTVFSLARSQGLRTAMVYSKKKFRHLAPPGSLDGDAFVSSDAVEVAQRAVELLRRIRPHILLVHFSDPDSAGHSYGWGNIKKGVAPSPQFMDALRRCDRATGLIVETLKSEGIWSRTLVIVTADHGGHDRRHGSDDEEDVLIPWIAAGGLAARTGQINRKVVTMDTAATAVFALGLPVPSDWDGKPVTEAITVASSLFSSQRPSH